MYCKYILCACIYYWQIPFSLELIGRININDSLMNLSRPSGVLRLSRSNIKYLNYTYNIVMNLKQLTPSVLMSPNYTSCKQPFPLPFCLAPAVFQTWVGWTFPWLMDLIGNRGDWQTIGGLHSSKNPSHYWRAVNLCNLIMLSVFFSSF